VGGTAASSRKKSKFISSALLGLGGGLPIVLHIRARFRNTA
jgi:hypothetical protein